MFEAWHIVPALMTLAGIAAVLGWTPRETKNKRGG
jgi:hypothetical protein